MRGPWPQGSPHEAQREAFRFQGFDRVPLQAVAQLRRKDLRSRIDAPPLRPKRHGGAVFGTRPRREVAPKRVADQQGEGGLAPPPPEGGGVGPRKGGKK